MITFIFFKLSFSEDSVGQGLRITKEIEDFIPKIFQNVCPAPLRRRRLKIEVVIFVNKRLGA